jgi:rubredoxin
MASFADTPRWKTRAAYDAVKDKPKPKRPKITWLNVPCPVCEARRGTRCEHYEERQQKARRARRAKRNRSAVKIRAAQERRWASVDVRFECPICGGDHVRADHHPATSGLLQRAQQAQQRLSSKPSSGGAVCQR